MAVRVRLRVRSKSAEVESSALVNTGFEAETPQLLLPTPLARQLSLYPPPPTASLIEVGTAGGPIRVFFVRDAVEVWVLAGDREIGPRTADVIISATETEVLISDKLAEDLGIVLIAPGSGRWKFIDDPPDVIRRSERPQYW
jgi:hypothetical protein